LIIEEEEERKKRNKYQLFVLLTGRESRVLAAAELGIGGVLLRDSF